MRSCYIAFSVAFLFAFACIGHTELDLSCESTLFQIHVEYPYFTVNHSTMCRH